MLQTNNAAPEDCCNSPHLVILLNCPGVRHYAVSCLALGSQYPSDPKLA